MSESTKKITGFKATDKELKCRNFQYKVGETYKADGEISLCNNGFHFCENPFEVLDHYDLCNCDFVTVESKGATQTDGKKTVTEEIKISAHIGLSGWIEASFDFLWSRCSEEVDVRNFAQLASSGDSTKLASSGDSAQLASSGNSTKLASSGDYGIAAGIGIENKAKGAKGNWLILAEWDYNKSIKKWIPMCVKVEQVDGERIKEDCWYILKNGKFMEVAA